MRNQREYTRDGFNARSRYARIAHFPTALSNLVARIIGIPNNEPEVIARPRKTNGGRLLPVTGKEAGLAIKFKVQDVPLGNLYASQRRQVELHTTHARRLVTDRSVGIEINVHLTFILA